MVDTLASVYHRARDAEPEFVLDAGGAWQRALTAPVRIAWTGAGRCAAQVCR